MIKLSNPGKMPCPSWSLQAIDTCPGAIAPDGELVAACKGCYATSGNYRFPNVKAPRVHNQQDWKRANWTHDMIEAITTLNFRWFDSGDMYDARLANKIYQVMKATPRTDHWLPTRMHKFAKFRPIINKMNKLPNVAVRRSSDSIHDKSVPGLSSTIYDPGTGTKFTPCLASLNEGKCGTCRQCWDKTIRVIAYPQHGKQMAKVNRDILATAA